MTPPVSVATIREIRDDLILQQEWLALAARAGVSYFQTPAWVISWWETIGRQPRTTVGIWRSDSRALEALVPLYLSRQRVAKGVAWPSWLTWEIVGTGPGAADHCDPPSISSRWADVAHWLGLRSAEHPVLLRSLGSWDDTNSPPRTTELTTTICPRLAISQSETETAGSRNFQKQLRYYERRLKREGVSFEWVPPSHMTHQVIDDLFRLHHQRRSARGLSTSLTPDRKDFHKRLVDRAGSDWGPCGVKALSGDQCIAVLYGFRWLETFYYYQSGWDPSWSNLNLGTTIVAQAIRLSSLDGAGIFDFLRGSEPYKYRFGAEGFLDRTLLIGVGLGAQLVKAKFRLLHSPRRAVVD